MAGENYQQQPAMQQSPYYFNPYMYNPAQYNPFYAQQMQRLQQAEQQLQQNYPQYQPQQTAPRPALPALNIVETEDAARKQELDLTGARQYFYAASGNEFYVRQFDVSTADVIFEKYVKTGIEPTEPKQPSDIEKIFARLDEIESKLATHEPVQIKKSSSNKTGGEASA